jgi:hypothetical protein
VDHADLGRIQHYIRSTIDDMDERRIRLTAIIARVMICLITGDTVPGRRCGSTA